MKKHLEKIKEYLGIVGYLRRIYEELKRANDLKEREMMLEYPGFKGLEKSKKKGVMVDLDTASIENFNKSYKRQVRPDLLDE